MKLWSKGFEINKEIENFTVGRDREMDLYLAKYDVLGSMAHITMLNSIGLIGDDAISAIVEGIITFPSQSPVDNVVKTYRFVKGTAANYSVTTVKGALTMKNSKNDINIKAAEPLIGLTENIHR